jgi:hypothetical protein
MNMVPRINGVRETARRILKNRAAFCIIVLCIMIIFVPVPPSGAEEYVSEDWQVSVTPYLWGVSLKGDVTVKGKTAEMDLSFSDILDDLNMALLFEAEARKNRVGLYINTVWMQLEDDTRLLDITVDLAAIGFGGYYRLGPWLLDAEAGASGPVLVTDIYAGGRYTYLSAEVEGKKIGFVDVDEDEKWVDPIIGVRTLWGLTPKWSLMVRGDIGGFGVGSDFMWQASGVVGYSFHLLGDDNAKFFAGYRAIDWDYSDGSGSSKFEWDMTAHGPLIGLKYHF